MRKPSPAEREIELAIQLVGEMPADARLDAAIRLLSDARNKVAEFVEEARR
jgi:hypothetical protein